MYTGIIIQARIGSSRLPGKVLLPLPNGMSVVGTVFTQCRKVDNVDVAVAVQYEDYDIMGGNKWGELIAYGGHENDVLGRYAAVSRANEYDRVVRITGDCPRVQAAIITAALELQSATGADYVSNVYPERTMARGLDVEVFTASLLREVMQQELSAYDREHVTPAMQRIDPSRIATLPAMEAYEHWSDCTLDTLEDYRKLWELKW